jgi:uncharacterized protein (DUF952 family)
MRLRLTHPPPMPPTAVVLSIDVDPFAEIFWLPLFPHIYMPLNTAEIKRERKREEEKKIY